MYAFWGTQISEWLNEALAEQGDDVVLNLASNEDALKVISEAIANAGYTLGTDVTLALIRNSGAEPTIIYYLETPPSGALRRRYDRTVNQDRMLKHKVDYLVVSKPVFRQAQRVVGFDVFPQQGAHRDPHRSQQSRLPAPTASGTGAAHQ